MKYILLLLLLIGAFTAQGATFTVTRNDDRNTVCNSGVDCSLREAVKAANALNGNDAINFSASLSKITLASEIVIENNGTLAIQGKGANAFVVSGNKVTRIFRTEQATVTISGMALVDGNITNGNGGGAIRSNGGSLVLESLLVDRNVAGTTLPPDIESGGGAYFNGGTHTIRNSTFSNNTASSSGGGIFNSGTLLIVNSTFSGNVGVFQGGAINNTGDLNLRNVTITNNTATAQCATDCSGLGGGVATDKTLRISNTIIAGNISTTLGNSETLSPEIAFNSGSVISSGNNLIGDSPGDSGNTGNVIAYQPTDRRDVDPLLGELRNNGGPTPTHALLFVSPAIDAGNNSNSPGANDQRGFTRIFNGFIDIGAFEFDPFSCTYTLSQTSQDISASGGTGSFTLTTQPGCSFTTVSNSDFIIINSSASSTGTQNVSFSVQANTGVARTGTITVDGQVFTVNQATGCSFMITVSPRIFTPSGGVGTVTVTTQEGCAWTASSPDSWISVAAGAGGAGSGTFNFTVARNTGAGREGTLNVAGQTFSISQMGKPQKRLRFLSIESGKESGNR